MIGIVIVTHGGLAKELVAVMEHVTGPQENIACIGIYPTDDTEKKRHEIIEKVAMVDTGDGVVILTDMFGGTPSNIATSLMQELNIEVISGVNVPLLVKLVRERNEPLTDAVRHAQEAGRHYIHVASELLQLDA